MAIWVVLMANLSIIDSWLMRDDPDLCVVFPNGLDNSVIVYCAPSAFSISSPSIWHMPYLIANTQNMEFGYLNSDVLLLPQDSEVFY
uniref:Secreted protein n=1 Tax=Panagrellus redivivus TaxID=6233 RepID=A0A7E4VW03_PANRE